MLTYQDTTHGQVVAQHKTRLGGVLAMRQNPWNAVMCLGHHNGRITMWTPNITEPVVSMQAHLGPIRALAVDPSGRFLASAGADKQINVWDLRKSYKRLHSYFAYAPPSDMDISQRGMLAVGYGSQVWLPECAPPRVCLQTTCIHVASSHTVCDPPQTDLSLRCSFTMRHGLCTRSTSQSSSWSAWPQVHVWKDALQHKAKAPYLTHQLNGRAVSSLRFCPYEDVLAIGHAAGLTTILVPGGGEPNYDSLVADPYQGPRARQEQEVHQLLDKIQPEMIALDPTSVAKACSVLMLPRCTASLALLVACGKHPIGRRCLVACRRPLRAYEGSGRRHPACHPWTLLKAPKWLHAFTESPC